MELRPGPAAETPPKERASKVSIHIHPEAWTHWCLNTMFAFFTASKPAGLKWKMIGFRALSCADLLSVFPQPRPHSSC